MRDNTVCAVVVTYNRKNLLLECLEAIRRQTRPVDAIYIIDNASTDGTPEVLKENGYIPELPPFNLSEPYEIEHKISNLVDGNPINVFYVRMYENTGSAGGFYEVNYIFIVSVKQNMYIWMVYHFLKHLCVAMFWNSLVFILKISIIFTNKYSRNPSCNSWIKFFRLQIPLL